MIHQVSHQIRQAPLPALVMIGGEPSQAPGSTTPTIIPTTISSSSEPAIEGPDVVLESSNVPTTIPTDMETATTTMVTTLVLEPTSSKSYLPSVIKFSKPSIIPSSIPSRVSHPQSSGPSTTPSNYPSVASESPSRSFISLKAKCRLFERT